MAPAIALAKFDLFSPQANEHTSTWSLALILNRRLTTLALLITKQGIYPEGLMLLPWALPALFLLLLALRLPTLQTLLPLRALGRWT